MTMHQQPQLWIISTEGTVESTFFNKKLDAARAGELGPRVAFFDWGLLPGEDPTDLDLVARRHPGYRYLFDKSTLVTAQQQLRDSPGEFARAYGNVRTGAVERVIPRAPWDGAAWQDAIPDGPVCFGAAVGVDAVDAAIVAAQRVTTSYGPATVVAVVKDGYGPGAWWALDRLRDLSTRYGAPIAVDRFGPSAALADEVKRADLPMVELDSAKVTAACSNTLTGITNPNGPTWRYKPHHALEAAAELATRRWVSDGAWVFGRRASVGSIAALEAGTLAAFGLDHMPAVRGMQLG